jgi:hypothetical protein
MIDRYRSLAILLVLVLVPGLAWADNGRVEINQITVAANGGFPFTISTPGSYVLTSDLEVADASDALVIAVDDVSLDLNGFTIQGPHVCDSNSCAVGTSVGIKADVAQVANAARSSVVDGQVRGFGAACISLGTDARVEGVGVSSCGRDGIAVSDRALLLSNRASGCGTFGLKMEAVASFSNNLLAFNDLGTSALTGGAYTGGTPGRGNVCDSGPCGGATRKRFYVTPTTFSGDQADNFGNCTSGFHFASIWEIREPSLMRYDTLRGQTLADSGQGAPAVEGWIRTGTAASTLPGLPAGRADCNAWSDPSLEGSSARPAQDWSGVSERIGFWETAATLCTESLPIWCVEN